MRFSYTGGHGRFPLFTNVTSQITQGGSVNYGAFDVQKFSRFTGYLIANSVGVTGLNFRYRFAAQSGGAYQVGSSYVVTSGPTAFSGTILDIQNYGVWADFAIITADSTTTYTAHLLGEPVR